MGRGYDPPVLRALAILVLLTSVSVAAPLPPSEPDDVDLDTGTCAGHPDADTLLAALPRQVRELVVLWPRVGRSKGDGCRTVGRLTLIDHMGHVVTASWVLRGKGEEAPPEGFVPWHPREGEERAERTGPPRNEMTWWPEGARPDLHVVVAGSPSAPEETLEGIIGFLSAVRPAGVLAASE